MKTTTTFRIFLVLFMPLAALLAAFEGLVWLGHLQSEMSSPWLFTLYLMAVFVLAAACLVLARGVTERRRTAAALRESERRYRELVESIHDFIWETDERGVFTYASNRCRMMLGYGPEELAGRRLVDWSVPEQHPVQQMLYEILMEQGEPFRMVETALVHADGRRVMLESSGSPRRGPDGKVLGWRGVSRDITSRRQAEEGLMKAQLEMEAVLAGLKEVLVAYLDPQMAIVWTNAGTGLATGSSAELKGRLCHKAYQGLDGPCPGCTAWLALETGEPQEGEITLPNGRVRMARSNPLRDATGRLTGVVHVALDITAHKRAARTLMESELRFSKVFSEGPMPMALTTLEEGGFVEANPAFMRLFGYQAEELFGHTTRELQFYAAPAERDALLARLRAPGAVQNHEIVLQDRARRRLKILLSMVMIRIEEADCLLTTLVDVTELKRMEADLAESRIRMQALFDSTQVAIIMVDDAMGLVDVNPAASELMGYSKEELLGMRVSDLLPPEDREDFSARQWEAIRSARRRNAGGRLQHRGGRMIEIEYCSTSQILPGLNLASIRDVTERKQAYRAVREAREFLRGVMDALTAEVAVLDVRGQVVLFNEAWANFGRKNGREPHLEEDNYLEVCRAAGEGGDGDAGRRVAEGIERVLRGEQAAFYYEYPCHSPAGQHWFEMRVSRFEYQGRIWAIIAHEEISERLRAQQALQRALRAAEASSIAKGQFLANMSHEIRTPMSAVIGMARLLLESPLNEEQRIYAETVARSGEALLTVINDILDFSKIEAGRLELESAEFDLRETVEDTAECLAFQAHRKGLELSCRIGGDVPAVLRGDRGRLRQVLINLAGNAIKFTERGEVRIEVRREPEDAGAPRVTLRTEIRDTGIGIPEDRLGCLFRSFSQVDPTFTRRYGGSGLGLAICRRLIELMDGRIGVESRVGEGSVFWFTVALEPGGGAAALAPEPAEPPLRGCRVLVADAHESSRQVLMEQLQSLGCLPEGVRGGREALRQWRLGRRLGTPHAALFLDGELPDLEGPDVARRIREEGAPGETAVILTASLGRTGQAHLPGREAGIDAVLNKPVKSSRLRETLVRLLGQAPPAAAAPAPARQDAPPAAGGAGVRRILLAEDNSDNQMIVKHILKRIGWLVDAVSNGQEALAALERAEYDLVLMDIQMPVMDGLEATRAIRRRERQGGGRRRSVIIAMTAHAMSGDRAKGLEAGMDGYLTKPVDPDELLKLVRDMERGAAAGPAAPPASPEARGPGREGPETAFDPAILLRRLDGDREAFQQIIAGYQEEAGKHLTALLAAWESGDGAGVKFHAHALKGSSANVGAEGVRRLALQAENAGAEGAMARNAPLAESLRREFEGLTKTLGALEMDAMDAGGEAR